MQSSGAGQTGQCCTLEIYCTGKEYTGASIDSISKDDKNNNDCVGFKTKTYRHTLHTKTVEECITKTLSLRMLFRDRVAVTDIIRAFLVNGNL